MSLAILFHFLCAQHVSDINISIIRSLRLCCWITTLVVCSWFDVCWCFGVIACCRLKPSTRIPLQTNHTETTKHIEPRTIRPMWVIQQNSRKLLMKYALMSETCWAHKKWNKISSDINLVFYSSTIFIKYILRVQFIVCRSVITLRQMASYGDNGTPCCGMHLPW